MSPQGCLTAFFIVLVAIWSLLIGGVMTAGWLGAEILEFLVRSFFADADSSRRATQGVVETLRALGFGVFAAIWAIGTGLLALMWFVFWRGARTAERPRRETVFEIPVDTYPPAESLKDVTPRRDGTPRDTILPPDRPRH